MYNLQFAMRYVYIVLMFSMLGLTACHKNTAEEEAQMALKEALEALEKDDHGAYLKHVDWCGEMDADRETVMRNVLKQHMEWRRKERAAVVSIDMIDAKMDGDTICTVYYQYAFADGTQETGAQKMVRYGDDWKIRLRN